ncbi:MAG: argininosuccinate lyase [Verrucomicrobiales bacterium]
MSPAKPSKTVSRSGRFSEGPAKEVQVFSESVSFDQRLWKHDIIGSMAHARMLYSIEILTKAECAAIVSGLEEIGEDIQQGRFEWSQELEDVHMNIEAALTKKVSAGAKLHTARSRNDQVALDMRMWVRDELVDLIGELRALQSSLLHMGQKYQKVLIPGYTHLQRAQPVFMAHHLLAYVEMLERDKQRFRDAFDRVNVCPLGSGALAGSTLKLNREMVARELGFVDVEDQPQVTRNSMDAVSDRDYMVECCASAALCAIHLSRMAEDLILWSSAEFAFIQISDAYTTGSSLMPQKKNPDMAELTRGKSGRVVGNLMALLTMLKGLPMTYNRDMQEDKQPLFDSLDTLRASLRIMAGMIRHTEVDAEVCERAASDPALLATDLADWLVEQGVPFREAHHLVGAVVGLAESKGCAINQLKVSELKKIDARFNRTSLEVFDPVRAMSRRCMTGSPGVKEVRKQLNFWKKQLK